MKGATLSVLLVALLCGTLIVLQSVPTEAVRVNRNRAPWTSSSVSSASQGSSASASALKSRPVSSSQSTDNDSEGEIESGSSSSSSSSSSSALGQSLPATGSSSRLASTISSSGSGSSVPRSSASSSSSSLSSASRSVSSTASGSSSRSGSSSASKSSRSSQSKSRSQGRVPKYVPIEDRYPDPSVLADPDDTSSSAEGPMTLASAQGSAKEFMNPSNLAGNPRDTQPEAENKPGNWPKLNQKVKGKPKPKPAVVLVMDNNNQVIRPKKPLPFPKVKGPSKFDQEQVFKNDLAAHHRSVVAQREKYAEQDLKKNKIALKKQAQKPSTQKGDDFDKAAAETGDAKVATAEAIARQRQLAFEAGLAEKRRAHSEGMKKGQEQLDRMLDKFSADAQRRQQQRSVQLTGLCALGLDCTAGWEDHGSVSMLFSTANWELNPFPPGAAVWRGWRWTNPRLCCATSPEAKIDNLIVLSKHCPAGSTFRGIGGMQLSTDDRSTNPFWPGGSFSGEFFWTHPQYCQVPEQAHLLRRSWCLFAAGSACPAGHGLTQFTDNGMGRVLMRSGDLNKNPFQPSTIQGVPSPWSGDFSKWVNPRICCYDVAGASKANEEIASDSKFSQTSASAEATKASRSLSGSSSSGSSSRSYSASSSSSSRSASLSASEASESGESGFEGSEESGSAESSRVSESATRSA